MRNVLNKYSVRTPVKHRKTAVYSRNRTVASQDFVSTAFLRYGAYPYSAVFCTAVTVYGTVVSPTRCGVYNYDVTEIESGMLYACSFVANQQRGRPNEGAT